MLENGKGRNIITISPYNIQKRSVEDNLVDAGYIYTLITSPVVHAIDEGLKAATPVAKYATKLKLKTPEVALEYAVDFRKEIENGQDVVKASLATGGQVFVGAAAGEALEASLLYIATAAGLVGFPVTATVVVGSAVAMHYAYDESGGKDKVKQVFGEAVDYWRKVYNETPEEIRSQTLPEIWFNEPITPSTTSGSDMFDMEIDYSKNEITSLHFAYDDPSLSSTQSASDIVTTLKKKNTPISPTGKVTTDDGQGNKKEYVCVEGGPDDILKDNAGENASLDTTDITTTTMDNGDTFALIGPTAQIRINDPALGEIVIPAQTFFQMIGERVEGFTNFVESVVKGVVESVEEFTVDHEAMSNMIAQIVAGIIEGRDIEDITKEIAVQVIASKGIEELTQQLAKTDLFKGALQNGQPTLSVDAVQGALTAIAVTAILKGRDAKLKDYVYAASTASIQRIVKRGVDSFLPKDSVTGKLSLANGAASAGVTAAVVTLAASVIAGNGINEDTLRAAATAGGIAAASYAIATYIAAGSAAGPIGIVVGAVLGVIVGNLFPHGGEKVYHHESIGFVKQPKPDGTGYIIVGVREAGALLRAQNGANDVLGTPGDDVLVGNDQVNVLVGNDGDDMLEGRGNDDAILAGTGDDYVEAGDGNDYVEGNEGRDKIYGGAGNDNILGGPGPDIILGGTGDDRIEGEEDDDLISGDLGNDIILAGPGNDYIHGGAGDDVLDGGIGNDVIDGSIGNDEAHGGEGNDVLFGDKGNDLLRGDEGEDIVYGDDGVDVLYGDGGKDILDGGKEADLLYGGLDNDVLFGQDGNDHLHGEIGDDYLVGGKGNDLLAGGEGNDVYVFNRGDGKDTINDTSGIQDVIRIANYVKDEITFIQSGVDLVLSAPQGVDRLILTNQLLDKNIELLVFSDGSAIDLTKLTFDANGVVSYTMSTADPTALLTQTNFPGTWQEVEEDRSFMTHNPSSTWYINNFDTNTITNPIEMELYNDVQVRATTVKKKSWYGRTRVTISYNDFFRTSLVGTEGSDRFVGAYWAETYDGLGGNDKVYGNSGTDTLNGGAGHDIIFGGSQNDVINAGEGHDKAYGGIGDDTINGDDGNDGLYGEWGSDTIHGGNGDDFISGGPEGDTLYGNAGHDVLVGDEGVDNIYGNDGNDFILAGDGDDVADGGIGEDYVEGGEGNDTLLGGDDNDILRGEDGNDNLEGGNGHDLLIGGTGADRLDGGSGIDTASYAESNTGININLSTGTASGGYAEGDTFTALENIIGSDYNDVLVGDSSANVLEGGYGNDNLRAGAGDDVLQGGAGADHLDGEEGWDKVSYADSASGVVIDFIAGTGKYGYAEGDTFANMEHVIGSLYDDKFIVGNSSATFEAGEGYDTVKLSGVAADYEIILDGNILTARHIANNQLYTFPDVERLEFTDVSYGLEDFPGDGDAKIIMNVNDSANGVILQNPGNNTVVLESSASYGSTVISADGTYSYIPQSNYIGTDTFAIRITNPITKLIRLQNVDIGVNVNGETVEKVVASSANQFFGEETDFIKLNDGGYVGVWTGITWTPNIPNGIDGVRQYQIRFQRYDANYSKVGAEKAIQSANFYISNNSANLSGEYVGFPKVAALSDGKLSLIWLHGTWTTNSNLIKQQTLNIDGNAVASIQSLTLMTGNNLIFRNAQVIGLSTGGYITGFNGYTENLNDIYIQRFDINNNKIRDYIFSINSNDDINPRIAEFPNGDLLTTWLSGSQSIKTDIIAKIIHPNGITSENINLFSPEWAMTNRRDIYGRYYDANILSDELFAIVFASSANTNYNVMVQVFNLSGSLIGQDNIYRIGDLGGAATGINAKVKITVVNDQYFLVNWLQILQPGVEASQVQLFDHACNRIGETLTLHTAGSGSQCLPFNFRINQGNVEFFFYDPQNNTLVTKSINLIPVLKGTSGNDVLQGNVKKNLLVGDPGFDVIDGKEENNTVSYQQSNAAINVNLSAIPFSDINGNSYILGHGGHAEGDRLRNVENIIGTSFNDTFVGGLGNNSIDGGDGIDITSYSDPISHYKIVMDEQKIIVKDLNINNGDNGVDQLVNIEQLNFVDAQFNLTSFPSVKNSIARVLQNGTASGVLGDSTIFSFVLDTPATNGTVLLNLDGTYTYQPSANYLGADTFSYIVTNAQGLGRLVNVEVEIANDIQIKPVTRTLVQANEGNDGSSWGPSVVALTNKNVLVMWSKSGTNYDGAYSRLLDSRGNALSADIKIDDLTTVMTADGQSIHAVALPGGAYIAFWSTSDHAYSSAGISIIAQKFDVNGLPIGNFTQVNTYAPPSGQYHPRTRLLDDGNVVVIWINQQSSIVTNGIWGRVFTQQLVPVTDQFNIDQGNVSNHLDVKALRNGSFIVAYDKVSEGTGYNIYLKKMNNNGTSIEDAQRINFSTTGDQRGASVAKTDTGGLVVTWLDYKAYDSSDNVKIVLRECDINGIPFGAEKIINTKTLSAQNRPDSAEIFNNAQIINLERDIYFVSWGDGTNIHAQIVDSQFNRMGEEFLLLESVLGGSGASWMHDATFIENGTIAVAWQQYDVANGDYNVKTKIIDIGYPQLVGTDGNDVLQSGNNNDVVAGGSGHNIYQTDVGEDIIVISINPNAKEVITDFDLSNDKIDLSTYNFLLNGFSDLKNHTLQNGSDTVINFGNDHTIILKNILREKLLASHFIGTASGNSLPVPHMWFASLNGNTTITLDVLAQTTDLDGDALNIISITNPLNGTAVVQNSTIVYTPDADFVGEDSIDYIISDGRGSEIRKTLILSVMPEIISPTPSILSPSSTPAITFMIVSPSSSSAVASPIPNPTIVDSSSTLPPTQAIVSSTIAPSIASTSISPIVSPSPASSIANPTPNPTIVDSSSTLPPTQVIASSTFTPSITSTPISPIGNPSSISPVANPTSTPAPTDFPTSVSNPSASSPPISVSSANSLKPFGLFSLPRNLMSTTQQRLNSMSNYFSETLSLGSHSQFQESSNQKSSSEEKDFSIQGNTFDLNGQLALTAVTFDLVKKFYFWARGYPTSENSPEKVNEETISDVQKFKALERLQKKLNKADKLLDMVEDDSSFEWAEFALEEHQYSLSRLLNKTAVTKNELIELKRDIRHFYKEFEGEIADQKYLNENILASSDFDEKQTQSLIKFGLFGSIANSTRAVSSNTSEQGVKLISRK